jgi:hypothetical protein
MVITEAAVLEVPALVRMPALANPAPLSSIRVVFALLSATELTPAASV